MNIVFFAHPTFLDSQSMPRFAALLLDGMKNRGHTVDTWTAKPFFIQLPVLKKFGKWMGYIDQYLVFPLQVKKMLKKIQKDTLFVFCDQALGPWVPLVSSHPHVIHCHDFLAQKSALGQIPENLSSWTGKQYQAYIRRGYSKGKAFINVSKKTQIDLHSFLKEVPPRSEVVYNGLNQSFKPGNVVQLRNELQQQLNIQLSIGFFLHVGGNLWYKNRLGVLEIYNAFRLKYNMSLPLLMIGSYPTADLLDFSNACAFKANIHWLSGLDDTLVRKAYSSASVFIFPSLAEGFGWPIAEAMASGCPVLTTNEAPMTEVAGEAAFLINKRPIENELVKNWAVNAADILDQILNLSEKEHAAIVDKGIKNIERFNTNDSLNKIESIYSEVFQFHKTR